MAGVIGASFTVESNALDLTPNAGLIYQTINVDRPNCTLVISQYCSGLPIGLDGNFDPSNNNGGFDPRRLRRPPAP